MIFLLLIQFILMGATIIVPYLFKSSVIFWGLPFIFFGSLLAFSAVVALKTNLTALPKPKKDGLFITSFPFSLSRNPIYVGFLIFGFGWNLLFHFFFGFILLVLLAILLHYKISLEEKFLKEKFGDNYLNYMKRVRRYL